MFSLLKIIIIFFFGFWIGKSYAIDFEQVCSNIEKINAIIVPYKPQAWPGMVTTPSGPVPTITYFTLNAREPILDFCTFWVQFQKLGVEGRIFAGASMFNKATDDRFAGKVGLALDYYDLAGAINTLGRGGNKADSVMIHRRFMNTLSNTQDEFSNSEEKTFENRFMRESKVNRMVRASSRLSVIKDFSKCSTGTPLSAEEEMFYDMEIAPLFTLLEEQTEESDFAMRQLQNMGMKFNSFYDDHKKYQIEIFDAVNKGVFYRRSSPKTYKKESYDKNGKKMVDQIYYTYSVSQAPHHFNNLKKYEKSWENYSITQVQTRGLAKGIHFHAESAMRDFSFECRRPKIEWKVRRGSEEFKNRPKEDSVFNQKIEQEIKSCRENSKLTAQEASSLYERYLSLLKNSLMSKARIQAKIWDFESRYRGNHVSVSIGLAQTELGEFAQAEINCEKTPNYAQSVLAKAKSKDVKIELKEIYLEEEMRKSAIIERESKVRRERELEERRKAEIIKEMELRKTLINDDLMKPNIEDINL